MDIAVRTSNGTQDSRAGGRVWQCWWLPIVTGRADRVSAACVILCAPASPRAFVFRLISATGWHGEPCSPAEALSRGGLFLRPQYPPPPPEADPRPLPAVAWMGLAMLGGMAGVGAMRRKRRNT